MPIGNQNHMEVPENLRKQLALAVRSIQWSYAIFWSFSSRQPGVLQWVDGYYNGEIKTRKTVQAGDLNPDQLGLQRSGQLRELYESLSLGETDPQAKRPTAALSPEDLTDAEWYFLVCMSFVFNIDQGLPGRTYAKNQPIWLCNAHRADTKVFSRSLLAKSASIQTIVCFPYLGGVIELGATQLVPEDPNLIQHIKNSFLDNPNMLDEDNMLEDGIDHLLDCPGMDINSPNNCSNEFADNLLREESNLVEGDASQMQSWPFMDDAISNCLNNNSMTSSDCVSQTYGEPETTAVPKISTERLETNCCIYEANNQECNQQQNSVFQDNNINDNNDGVHYQSVLSSLLKSSDQLILGPYFRKGSRGYSSFVGWRKDGPCVSQSGKTPQKLLKKVLFEVARMHENSRLESGKQNCNSKQEVEETDKNHVLSERKRREKINERFTILGSLVPSGGKADKVSILDHTIQYLRDLEKKVEELERYKEAKEIESGTKSKSQDDAIERTSDNYGPNINAKKTSTNKRKGCEMDNSEAENKRVRLKDSSTDYVSVSISDKDVLIELRCSWKECVLVDVMEAVKKLRMDAQSVESSNNDGVLSMTVKAKFKGLKAPTAGVIKQALQKVVKKC